MGKKADKETVGSKGDVKAISKVDKHLWVVLLCGLPGSGKSTLRGKLAGQGWRYVSQDELGSLDECAKMLIKALKSGKSCLIDRCNVTSGERRLCMQFATRALEKGEVKGVKLHFEAVWMATPPDVCKLRAAGRTEHETLSADKAPEVVDKFCRGLTVPQRTGQEPYEVVLSVACEDDEAQVLCRYADPFNIDVSVKTSLPAAHVALTAEQIAALDDSLPAELVIFRHGERADRAKGRDDGFPADPVLTKEGKEMAKRAGIAVQSLTGSAFAAVYSSPFCRCLQTADQIAGELNLLVRVEPGLGELCSTSVFAEAPQLRSPVESVRFSLQRSLLDCSVPPVCLKLPEWPEEPRDANKRVIAVAKALAARHAGQRIALVCHSHSLVEITRHMPNKGGGAAEATAGYCSMSHISQVGILLRCLDLSYLKGSSSQQSGGFCDASEVGHAAGHWSDGWRWIDPETLLAMPIDEVLEKFHRFREAFDRGNSEQQRMWHVGWAAPDDDLRRKLQLACANGMF